MAICGKIAVCGGLNPDNSASDECFHGDGKFWEKISLMDHARSGAAAVFVSGKNETATGITWWGKRGGFSRTARVRGGPFGGSNNRIVAFFKSNKLSLKFNFAIFKQ